MRCTIWAVGTRRKDPWTEIMAEYELRLKPVLPTAVCWLRPAAAALPPVAARRREAAQLLEHSQAAGLRVALDAGGKPLSSEQFAAWLDRRRDQGLRDIAFLVGSATGLDANLAQACHFQLSLSPLTLAHKLALVVLLEQLYRATSIWHGTPYHK